MARPAGLHRRSHYNSFAGAEDAVSSTPLPNAEAFADNYTPSPASAVATYDAAVTAVPVAQSHAPTQTWCTSPLASFLLSSSEVSAAADICTTVFTIKMSLPFPLLLVHLLKYLCKGMDAKVCSGGHHIVSSDQGPHQLTAIMKAALPETQLVRAAQLLP